MKPSEIDIVRKQAGNLLGLIEGQHRRALAVEGQIADGANTMHERTQGQIDALGKILSRGAPGMAPEAEKRYQRLLDDRRRCKVVAARSRV